MTNGVVAGKFWPYHKGHALLLHSAAGQCDFLHILLVGRSDEWPSPTERALGIAQDLAYAGHRFQIHIVGDIETLDDTEESSQVWAKYTPAILGFTPDVVFSSEEYGIRWAGYMGVPHIMVDLARKTYPVSGTQVRNNYYAHKNYLPAQTRAQVLPRVVVMGSESTGTTTLADALGKYYNTVVVPEFGREIAEDYYLEHGVGPPLDFWDEQQFRLVAHGQNAIEERLAREANGVLICDTDALATSVWYERYRHKRHSLYFDKIGLEQAKKHSLYIITSPEGIEWEDDGTRDGKDERMWMHESFLFQARKVKRLYGIPWIEVKGDPHERLAQAVQAIDRLALDKNAYNVLV